MSELDKLTPRVDESVNETDEPVQYRVEDGIAILTMSRPKYNNVQNSQMTYALDDLFARAINVDNVKVIMLTSTMPSSMILWCAWVFRVLSSLLTPLKCTRVLLKSF